ncbi:MAG TPA: hypothetical protein VFW22_13990 [Pseudolabrys sp.]|nr:hypothetical protein [Pseudolabrys sp.]
MNQSIASGTIRYYTIGSESERPAGALRAAAAVADRIFDRFLTSLYETRQRQAALIIARHRHLLAEAETGPHRETPTKNLR